MAPALTASNVYKSVGYLAGMLALKLKKKSATPELGRGWSFFFFSQFCVVDSRELDCLLFTSVCKDVGTCRSIVVASKLTTSTSLPRITDIIFASRCHPSCVTAKLPVTGFFSGVNFQRFHYWLPIAD